jgi:GH15 family glucan-1,4-alpha-glucosidase
MPRIEDYALLGDTHTAALVNNRGSIDWLCLPRFDSAAPFAALLGNEENGRWQIAPDGQVLATRRRYRGDTLVLETDFDTAEGSIRLVDFMPPRGKAPDVVRLVEGIRGRVRVHMDLRVRFDYGRIRPRLRQIDRAHAAIAGPDSVWLRTPVETREEGSVVRADFVVKAGELVPFVLTWHPSNETAPAPIDPLRALADTESYWTEWVSSSSYSGEWREPVVRSLLTLKALTYAPTGGIVAAPTTSLPEPPGGARNWDYRFCWLRDAAITLLALTRAGFRDEAEAWNSWLLRAVAGDPADLQVVYGVAGERRLTELELPWLDGYQGAKPVRIGNGATEQLQLDIYGQVVNTMHHARRAGLEAGDEAWSLTRSLLDFVEAHWREPDEGLWKVRGPRRHFVNSKVMSWVAVDRALSDAEEFGFPAPLARWRRLRQQIHGEVLTEGYDADRRTFTQYFGSAALDASALLLPLIGFLPASDERMRGTVAAIERELCHDGLVYRYSTADDTDSVDGLPEGEGTFLACSFWLAANRALSGRLEEGRALFERLLSLRNDVGLLADEYDPSTRRQLGNFPQAFSHVPLIMAAHLFDEIAESGPTAVAATDRPRRAPTRTVAATNRVEANGGDQMIVGSPPPSRRSSVD